MLKTAMIAVVFVLALVSAADARIRCGNDLISEGDSSFDVEMRLEKCDGQVLRRQVIGSQSVGRVEMGTTYDRRGRTASSGGTVRSRSADAERWQIRLDRICWRLLFVAGVLEKIEGWDRCD